jgi:formylglycine-generating enzyme
MKRLLISMLVGLMIVGCGEEAKKKTLQEDVKGYPRDPLLIPCEACGGDVAKETEKSPKCVHPAPDSVVAYKEVQELALIMAGRKREEERQELITKRIKPLIEKKENFVTDNKLEMIWVKPGAFMMDSPVSEAMPDKDDIQHKVYLTKGFYLGKHEVTQAQWEQVTGNNPSNFKAADRPVENVSWNDVVEFCKKLTENEKKAGRVPQGMSYQLPTEAQWEYACRAGTTTMYSWGDSISSSNANYYGNEDATTPVGKYPANPWGFHDMHGNAWEWCTDWYTDYLSGPVTDPIGPVSGSLRVNRGGSWNYVGRYLRSALRGCNTPSGHHINSF